MNIVRSFLSTVNKELSYPIFSINDQLSKSEDWRDRCTEKVIGIIEQKMTAMTLAVHRDISFFIFSP